jgi:hypothetical protein
MARSMVPTSDARRRLFSPSVARFCTIDGQPGAKAKKLRELAAWYRAFAARAANPFIWESRLRDALITHLTMAEGLGPLLANIPTR